MEPYQWNLMKDYPESDPTLAALDYTQWPRLETANNQEGVRSHKPRASVEHLPMLIHSLEVGAASLRLCALVRATGGCAKML